MMGETVVMCVYEVQTTAILTVKGMPSFVIMYNSSRPTNLNLMQGQGYYAELYERGCGAAGAVLTRVVDPATEWQE
jgi:hypothetical protein